MKKQFKTFAHQTAKQFDTIYFSGGRVGSQVEMSPENLLKAVDIVFADLIRSTEDWQKRFAANLKNIVYPFNMLSYKEFVWM